MVVPSHPPGVMLGAMKNLFLGIGLLALGSQSVACVSYSGVHKAQDGQLYISGGTSYFVYSQAWVRRCDVDGNQLHCEELTELASAPRGQRTEPAKPAAPAAPAK